MSIHIWPRKHFKAKKEQKCDMCYQPIRIGDTYSRTVSVYENVFQRVLECYNCEKLLKIATEEFGADVIYEGGEYPEDIYILESEYGMDFISSLIHNEFISS